MRLQAIENPISVYNISISEMLADTTYWFCKFKRHLHEYSWPVNILWPENRHYFTDNIFKCILLNECVCISIKMPLKFVLKGLINDIPALIHVMA